MEKGGEAKKTKKTNNIHINLNSFQRSSRVEVNLTRAHYRDGKKTKIKNEHS